MLLVGVVLAGACSSDRDAGPEPRPDNTPTTLPVDRSGIALAGVPGQTTTTIVERGTATISGAVQGPSGLVPGATVRIERLVAGREIRTDVVSGPDGRYTLPLVPGGRYRIRAFLAPTLAQVQPEVQFLSDGKEHTIDLKVERHSGLLVRAAVAPSPPLLDGAVNLVILVSTRSVGDDGVVRSTPVAGSNVELTGLGRWSLRTDDDGGSTTSTTTTTLPGGPSTSTTGPTSSTTTTSPNRRTPSAAARTDAAGRVRYELRCESPGAPGLALRVPVTVTPPPDDTGAQEPSYVTNETIALDLPACIDPATTTTTTTATPSTTATP
ncbi:MAG: carboxypeptidase-like regulatory domain-containing protein [Microthrixaceae bacterium]